MRQDTLSRLRAVEAVLAEQQPCTLRGLFYRCVSAGIYPDTSRPHYQHIMRLMNLAREQGRVPFSWLVDSLRQTHHPSAWSGLRELADCAGESYRLDFWSQLPEYVHIITEKDAIAGTILPTTDKWGVSLSVCRGFASLSFAHGIGSLFREIEKPLHVGYLGDWDPSGVSIEDDLREKIYRYSGGRDVEWTRLAVNPEDFDTYNLLDLGTKTSDSRARNWEGPTAEVDAIPAPELRRRVKAAIVEHVPLDEWVRLTAVEAEEKRLWSKITSSIDGEMVQ